MYLKPFNRACLDSLSIMTAYSSYDGIPAIADKREFPLEDTFGPILTLPYSDLLTDIVRVFHFGSSEHCPKLLEQLRNEWGYKYLVTSDAGAVDLLITTHGTCADRECAARTMVENYSIEMGGGTYTYLTLPGEANHILLPYLTVLNVLLDQVQAGNISVKYIDDTVKSVLRTKFALGLFESTFQSVFAKCYRVDALGRSVSLRRFCGNPQDFEDQGAST